MSAGINISITADTAAAAVKMQQFFNGAVGGLNRLSSAAGFLQRFGSQLAAAFSVGSLIYFGRQVVNTADQIGKLAEKTGVAANTIAALRKQGATADLTLQDIETGLGLLSQQLVQAVERGGDAAKAFERLGVSIRSANGELRPTEDVLQDIAQRFSELPDGAQKTAAAMDLFGRSGKNWVPLLNEGAEGMRRMKEQGGGITQEMVERSKQFNDRLAELKLTTEDVFISIANGLLPTLINFASSLKNGIEQMQRFVETSPRVVESAKQIGIALGAIGLAAVAGRVGSGIGSIIGGTASALFGAGAIKSVNDLVAAIKLLPTALNAAAPALLKFAGLLAVVVDLARLGTNWFGLWRAKADEAFSVQNLERQMNDLASAILRVAEARRKAGEMSDDDFERLRQQVNAAKLETTTEAASAKLRSISRGLLPTAKPQQSADYRMTLEDFNALRNTDKIRNEWERVQSAMLTLGASTRDQLEVQLTTILLTIKKIEDRRQLTGVALEQGLINQDDQRRLELEDNAELLKLKQEQLETTRQLNQFSFFGGLQEGIRQLSEQWTNFGGNVANVALTGMQSAIDAVSNSIVSAIEGTKVWGQNFYQVSRQIIGSLIQIATQYVAGKLAMMAVDAIFNKKSNADAAKTTAISGAAGVAKAGEQGGWVGVLVYLGVFAAALAAVAGLAAAATGGFAQGGLVEGPGTGTSDSIHARLSRGEFVIPAAKVSQFGPSFFESIRAGQLTPMDFQKSDSSQTGISAISPFSHQKELRIVVIDDRRQIEDLKGNWTYETHFVDMMKKHMWRFR